MLAFYLAAFRTTSSGWAYYYHIASVPPAILLMAAGAEFGWRSAAGRPVWKVLLASVFAAILLWDTFGIVQVVKEKRTTSDIYKEAMTLRPLLAEPGLIVVPGGPSRGPTGFPVAYNASHLFYWLDRKGFNFTADNALTMDDLHWYENHGVRYFILGKPADARAVGVKLRDSRSDGERLCVAAGVARRAAASSQRRRSQQSNGCRRHSCDGRTPDCTMSRFLSSLPH